MEFQDYYKILNVDRKATTDDIKKQYRRLARKYHPDVSTEANTEEKFKQVKEAYEVLKDPEKRQAYDQFGSQWKQGQGFEPPPGWQQAQQRRQTQYQHVDPSEFSDFFEHIFGQGYQRGPTARRAQQKGQDQHSKVTLTLQEAYAGTTRSLTMKMPEIDPNTKALKYTTKTLHVKIPAGVTQGKQIRLKGQGSSGIGGGSAGDLYLEISIQPDHFYTLDGQDVHLRLPITPWEAALGASITAPTLAGNVSLTIPAGTQSGNKLRLKGRGLPGTPAGDQFVHLDIYIPEPKTEEQKKLYQQMQQQMDFNPRKKLMTGR